MKTLLTIAIVLIQCFVTGIMLFVIYMTFVLLDYQGGIDGLIGTTILQPIIGGVLSVLTTGFCLLIGLPIRIVRSINDWWIKNFYISILGILVGFVLLGISFLPSFRDTVKTMMDGHEVQKEIPDMVLALTGWFVTAFSMVHLFPPNGVRLWIENLLERKRVI